MTARQPPACGWLAGWLAIRGSPVSMARPNRVSRLRNAMPASAWLAYIRRDASSQAMLVMALVRR